MEVPSAGSRRSRMEDFDSLCVRLLRIRAPFKPRHDWMLKGRKEVRCKQLINVPFQERFRCQSSATDTRHVSTSAA